MATLKNTATGNWTAAGTWALCDATSELDSESLNTALTTSYVASSAFTPGAITIAGICVKLASRATSPSGTISVELFNSSLGSSVAGTEVTINVSDLPQANTTDGHGGWVYFKFSASVLLLVATNYQVRAKTSVASQVNLYRDATANNWTRQLVTTTTQAPAAGDKFICVGDKTGAGTANSYIITMDETTTTDYGTGSTTVPSIWFGHDCILTYGTNLATNYNLRVSGIAAIGDGGFFIMGSSGAEIPRGSTAKLEFDCTTDGEFYLHVRGGFLTTAGLSPTAGKNISACLLNADAAAGATTLTVDTDTGWKSGSQIGIASTSTTYNQNETRTLSADAGATSMTITAGLTNSKTGVNPVKAEIILLDRNVRVTSVSSTHKTNIRIGATPVVNCSWSVIDNAGWNSSYPNLAAVAIGTTTGSATFSHCISHTSEHSGFVTATNANNVTLTDCRAYAMGTATLAAGFTVNTTTNSNITLNNCWSVPGSGNSYGFFLSDQGITATNLRAASANVTGIHLAETNISFTGTFSNWYSHSNSSFGITLSGYNGSFSNLYSYRNAAYGINMAASCFNNTVTTFEACGNVTAGILMGNPSSWKKFTGGTISGLTGFAQANGVAATQAYINENYFFENCDFGVATGVYTAHTTADINCSLSATLVSISAFLRNCRLASTVEVINQSVLSSPGEIIAIGHDAVAGSLKIWDRFGTITTDTTIFSTASPSIRSTPTSASNKLEFIFCRAAVASGSAATISVKVRESVVGDGTAYNGSRIQLVVKRNVMAGITSDTVLATATAASSGAFETITGTTASVSGNCILEFAVRCDGTTGWTNIDDVTAPAAVDTLGFLYADPTLYTISYGNNTSGGGGGSAANYYLGIL